MVFSHVACGWFFLPDDGLVWPPLRVLYLLYITYSHYFYCYFFRYFFLIVFLYVVISVEEHPVEDWLYLLR